MPEPIASPWGPAAPPAEMPGSRASAGPCADAGRGAEGRASRPRPSALDPRLREAVARIEAAPLHRLRAKGEGPGTGRAIPLGLPDLDSSLCRGIPAGLTELRLAETRDAGAGAGFALALAILAGASARRPIVWIGERHVLHEAGFACAAGLRSFGLDPRALLLVATQRLEEALWAGEEAARSRAPALVVLEARGNPKRLGLEGTRRLHVRAKESGRPLLVLRQAGLPETSAAPLRLCVAAEPSVPPEGLEDGRLLGAPAFRVAIEKSRDGRSRQLLLEWNPHELRFALLPRPLALPGAVPAVPVHRSHPAREAGAVVALRRAS